MASTKSINRVTVAALTLCIYTHLAVIGVSAQELSAGVSSGATPTPGGAPPPPTVPDLSSAVTPEVAAVLAHPTQETHVIDFGQLPGGVLNVAGDFINISTLYLVSTNDQVQTATISAGGSILNSGIISTIVPQGGIPGYSNLISTPLNLVLNAVNSIVNLGGQITSAGNLTVSAGNSIVNMTSPTTSSAAIMSAVNNVSMQTSNLVNTGSVMAATGNINIASAMAASLAINATGGQFQALQGAINLRDSSVIDKVNLNMLGGDWLSRELNFYSGSGIANLSFNDVLAPLNGSTGELFIRSEGVLRLGSIAVIGDPYVSTPDDIIISNNLFSATEVNLFSLGNIIFEQDAQSVFAQQLIRLEAAQAIVFQGDGVQLSSPGILLKAGGDIDGTNLQFRTIPSENQVTAFGVHVTAGGAINAPGLDIQSRGYNVNLVAHGDLNASDAYIDSSGPNRAGKVFLASVNGSVLLKGENDNRGSVTTGNIPSQPSPVIGGLQRVDIAIAALNAITVNDVLAKGGDIHLSAGAFLEDGGPLYGWIINDSFLGSGGITAKTISSRGFDQQNTGDVFVFSGNGPLNVHTAAGNGHSLQLGTNSLLTVATPIINDSVTKSHPTVVLVGNSDEVMTVGGNAPGSFHISAKSAFGFARVTVANVGSGGLLVEDGAIDVRALIAGDGGEIRLGGANVTVNGSLHADAVGDGNGGAILIDLVNNITVNGSVTANGAGTGYGGYIQFRAFESINVHGTEITANAGEGAGGFVQMASLGQLNIPAITANAGKQGLGGLVLVLADDASTVPISITANGAGSEGGGRITIESRSHIDFSTINVTAKGGENGGPGGWIAAFADGNLLVDTAKFDVSPGLNGDGGHVTLRSGSPSTAAIFQVTGNINVDGNGTGNGGRAILFSSGTGAELNIGKEGHANAIYARSGTEGGKGGYIEVTAGGNLTVAGSALHADVRGQNGNGGEIVLRSGDSEDGGGIIIGSVVESSTSSTPATLTLTGRLNVNAAGTGIGGTIRLIGKGENGTIIVNEKSSLTATGTVGGWVSAEAGKDLTISSAINASSVRGDGKGGLVELKAGVNAPGTLTLTADVNANGHGVDGNGGVILIESSGEAGSGDGGGGGIIIGFSIGALSGDGSAAITSSGGLHADAGEYGTGGLITVNAVKGGLTVGDSLENESFTARGGTTSGDGGNIIMNSEGMLTLGPGTASVKARGTGNGGGILLTSAADVILIPQP